MSAGMYDVNGKLITRELGYSQQPQSSVMLNGLPESVRAVDLFPEIKETLSKKFHEPGWAKQCDRDAFKNTYEDKSQEWFGNLQNQPYEYSVNNSIRNAVTKSVDNRLVVANQRAAYESQLAYEREYEKQK